MLFVIYILVIFKLIEHKIELTESPITRKIFLSVSPVKKRSRIGAIILS